mmetsp:Transcript_21229/g.23713  ORF Transcript_21229/g.23713 Transcript_21229/m.23713 type:complete len:304 (+) Transcript_21229:137-1048(+)
MTSLPTVKLHTGAEVPALGFGTWQIDPWEVAEAVKAALEAGYRHIDCAEGYYNEAQIGEVFAEQFKSGKLKRKDLFITSKVWGTNFDIVEERLKNTLKELQVDYLDLYLLHCPTSFERTNLGFPAMGKNGEWKRGKTPIHVVWKQLESFVDQGLVKAIGISNFPCLLLNDLLTYARIQPAVHQIEVHPYFTNEKLSKWCRANGIVITGFSPLGSGKKGGPMEDTVIQEIAKKHKVTPAQVLIRWSSQLGNVVLAKSKTPERIKQNLASFSFTLTEEEMKQITELNKNWKVCDHAVEFGIPVYD